MNDVESDVNLHDLRRVMSGRQEFDKCCILSKRAAEQYL